MRSPRFVLVVMLVAVALAALWYFLRDSTPPSPSSPPAPQVPAIHPTEDPVPATTPGDPLIEVPAVAARVEAPEPESELLPAAAPWPRARVFGRLVDDQQAPAADVKVSLSAVGGSWAQGQTVPVVERRGWKIEEFSTKSGADGRFEFDVPVPTADWISLYTHAPDYLGLAGKEFGPAGGRNQPRITAGDNDIGELVLAITGAASGEVRAVDGTAVGRADISLEGSYYPGGYGVGVQADAGGRFVLGHVPEGTWAISAKAEGYLSATISNVEVKRRATTPGLAFRLERAPTISGRVVDEDGKPLEKMWIWGWPIGSGKGAGATSKADGTFVIHLPQDEPYTLMLEERSNKGRFEPWGGPGSDKLFDPGTSDVLVQLKRALRTTFVVVDDKTGAAVEKYAITLAARPDGSGNTFGGSFRPSKVESHPDGECTLAADPERHRAQVVAPGFEDLEIDVAHDDPARARQTLRMKPGAVLVGRVRHGARPVAGAKLVLARDFIKIDASLPDTEDPFDENFTTDLSDFLGRRRAFDGAPDGSFRIGDLAAGTYVLTVEGGTGAPKTLRGLRVESGATRDLGEIVLQDSGTLHVVLVTGPGQEAMDISLGVDQEWGGSRERSGAQREFTFKNLVPGDHKLFVWMRGSGLSDSQESPFTITADATTELTVDLTAKAPCKTRIRVVARGRPVAGLEVAWESLAGERRIGSGTLGTTNDEGFATGSLPGGVEARFLVKSDSGLVVGRSPASARMPPASLHESEIEVRSGTLVVEFPASVEIPEDGSFHLMLRGADGDHQMTSWSTPHSRFPVGRNRWTEHRCTIGAIAPGTYEMSLGAQKRGEGNSYIPLLGHFTRTITIADEETTVVSIVESPAIR